MAKDLKILKYRPQAGRVKVSKGFTRAALAVKNMGSDKEIHTGRVRVAGPLTRAASRCQMQNTGTGALFAILTDLYGNYGSMGAP